jgi:hypothetical protein
LRNEINAEASMCWRLNSFLLFAFNIAMDSRSEEIRPLEIHREPRWSFGPVQYKDQAVKLSGYPSYALWYGEEDEAASNVIVTQSKRLKRSDKEIAEVLGYMGDYIVLLLVLYFSLANLVEGFVNHHRKNANKAIFPVYGVATDSRTFHFVRLDNDSTVCLFNMYHLIEELHSNTF